MHLPQRAHRRFLLALTGALLVAGTLAQASPAAADTPGFFSWGRNSTWQLGDGTQVTRTTPTAVPQPSLTALASGQLHACGLTSTSVAYCWGDNVDGQLGIGTYRDQSTPQSVTMPVGITFASITAGALSTCALTTDGDAYCWGDNSSGQLGIGNQVTKNSPQSVTMPSGVRFTSISAGFAHVCALATDGAAYCWGDNFSGQLGIGNLVTSHSPQLVSMPSGITFSSIHAGSISTCAQTSNGSPYCWGSNVRGQLGLGNTDDQTTPQPVIMPAGVTFDRLVTGGNHVCAIADNSSLYCWGYNAYGQLGLGNTDDQRTPQLVSQSTSLGFTQLYGALRHTCALTGAGSAYCWGYNSDGQLGIGNTTNANTPQALAATWTFSALALGSTSVSTYALPIRPAYGGQVPTAPMQQFVRSEPQTCERQPDDLVDFPALTELKDVKWGASWAQWPNGGTGGFVCTRQPYYTAHGTWDVR